MNEYVVHTNHEGAVTVKAATAAVGADGTLCFADASGVPVGQFLPGSFVGWRLK